MYIKCMDLCSREIMNTKEKIGGKGKTVEIDERVFSKRKYNKGRLVKQKWVVGGIERKEKRMFLIGVEKRNTKTLTKIIEDNVEKKTTIITDKWKDYETLKSCNYDHMKVNYSMNFVNPETGEQTNTIESIWGKVYKNIKKLII